MAKPTHEEISRLACHLYEREGKHDGKDLEHWLNAESMCKDNLDLAMPNTISARQPEMNQ